MVRAGRVLFSIAILAVVQTSITAPVSAGHTLLTISNYVNDPSHNKIRNRACADGDKVGRMVLLFGQARSVDGKYGASLFGHPRTRGQVATIVKEYVRGYAPCKSITGPLVIGVGVSNFGMDNRTDAWVRGHGKAWSKMVRTVHDWARQNYSGANVWIVGATDFEPAWSTKSKANLWTHGYDFDHPDRRPLYAVNSSDGCPPVGGCLGDWDQQALYHVSYEHQPARTAPQVYNESGTQATQWLEISKWGHQNSGFGAIWFEIVTTQRRACGQVGGCAGRNNKPHDAHIQLRDALKTDSNTKGRLSERSTDIRWLNSG